MKVSYQKRKYQTIKSIVSESNKNDGVQNNEHYLSQSLKKWENLNYFCTSIITSKNISIADIKIEQFCTQSIQDKYSFLIKNVNIENSLQFIYDPITEYKKFNVQEEDETLVDHEEIQSLCNMSQICYGRFKVNMNDKNQAVQFVQQPSLTKLSNQVNQLHKSRQKIPSSETSKVVLKIFDKKKQIYKKSRKIKKNICTINQFREIQYLYKVKRISKQQLSKRFNLPQCKLNKIISQLNVSQIYDINTMENEFKYKKLHQRSREAIQNLIKNTSSTIQSSDIQKLLKNEIKLRVSNFTIRNYLKHNLNMTYRLSKSITYRHNQLKTKLQRQLSAQQYIKCLYQGKILINIDESLIQETDQRKRGWFQKGQNNFQSHSQRLHQVSIIAGISSEGDLYYSPAQGKNNSATFMLFMLKFIERLEYKNKEWRQSVIFVIDNARYHRSKLIMDFYKKMNIPVLYLGPYSFKMAPVEFFFSFIKSKDLNIFKTQAESRNQTLILMKEISYCISQFDFSWIKQGFCHALQGALIFLSLSNI